MGWRGFANGSRGELCAMMRSMTLDPAIGLLLVAALALLFAGASAHKLRNLRRFEEIFAAYGLLPALAEWHFSWLIPAVELGVGVGLLGSDFRPYAAAVGIV